MMMIILVRPIRLRNISFKLYDEAWESLSTHISPILN